MIPSSGRENATVHRHKLTGVMTPGPARPLLTVDDLATMLAVAPKTIYQWRSRRPEPYGSPAIKVGKYLRWRREDVDAWIDQRSE